MISNAVARIEDAVVARGQRAWSKIKTTAAEQRQLWREVGEALAYGRLANMSNQKFGQWCKDLGFSDMDASVRSNAMWLAANWSSCTECKTESHPTHVRAWFNEQQKTADLPIEDTPAFTVKQAVEISPREASKAAKLISRSKSGDEGSEIAKRHLKALVKKLDTTVDELEEAVSVTIPEEYYRLPPSAVSFAQELRVYMKREVSEILAGAAAQPSLTKEAVISIYMSVLNELKSGI